MRMISWASYYWLIGWFGLGFLPLEFLGLFTGNPQWTLSETVWALEGLNQRVPFWQPWNWNPMHWVVFIGMVWLSGHFDFHIWR